MKKYIFIICCLIGLIISGCGPSELITPTLTPTPATTSTPAATSTPTETPEEIIANAMKTACEMIPAISPTVGISTGGSAVARLCPDVESGITLPKEWTANTPGDLLYVVAVQNGVPETYRSCGPYTVSGLPEPGGETYVEQARPTVKISLINTQMGKVVDSATISRHDQNNNSSCPSKIYNTSDLITGDPPSTQDVQNAIVGLLSNQVNFPTLRTLPGANSLGIDFAFSPDGKLLASGQGDETVKLWDVASGEEVRTLTGQDIAYSVAFSPDGKLLASGFSGGTDNPVILWDVASGQEVHTLTGHT